MPEHQGQHVGQCLCGAVRFTVTGELSTPNACHCAMCRRWHGALGVYTTADLGRIDLQGADHVVWYRSGPETERGFCRDCGSKLFWRRVGDQSLDIAVGALEPPTGLKLAKHIWVAFKGDYYDIQDDLPQYAQSSAKAQPMAPAAPEPLPATKPAIHIGQCLCGAIHLTFTGPIRDISVCHCGQCRRWHGHAPDYSKARWADIEMTGREYLRWYESSGSAQRGFCGQCGSSLFWQSAGSDAVAVAAGLLDDPSGLRERHHIFVADKGDCYDIIGSLPQFPASGTAIPF